MTHGDNAPSDRPRETHLTRRRLRTVLMIVGVVGASLAGVAFVGGTLWGLDSAWSSITGLGLSAQGDTAGTGEDRPFARGRSVFEARCARCHGSEGHGNGPDAAALRPPLTDLASASWRSGATHDAVRQVVANGTSHQAMPRAAGALSAPEMDAVVDYVLSLEITSLLTRAGFSRDTAQSAAPPLSFRDAEGTLRSLEQYRGKVVLLAFWGTTCIPCMEELPELEELADRFRETEFVLLPVAVDETDAKKASDVAARHAANLVVYTDSDGSARQRYDVAHLPQATLLDRESRVLGRSFGALRWTRNDVEELLCACLGVPFPLARSRGNLAQPRRASIDRRSSKSTGLTR